MKNIILTLSISILACRSFSFDAALTDPLSWVYADSTLQNVERMDVIDVPQNGVIDANIFLKGLDAGKKITVYSSHKDGEWYRMRSVPVKRNTGKRGFLESKPGTNPYVARRAPFEVYDVLEPIGQVKSNGTVISDVKNLEALRFRMDCAPKGLNAFTIKFKIVQGSQTKNLSLKVNVHPVLLPKVGKDSFKYTNWMSFESMADSHGLERWSEEHWKMIEKYVRLATRGRQNVSLMNNVFVKDANGEMKIDKKRFSRILDIYDRAGIWYLEGRHLAGFSNGWGSPTFNTAYTKDVSTSVQGALALSKLAKQYMTEIEERGLKDRWFQHVADEPGGKNIGEYRITSGIVHKYMPGIPTLDAVESPSFAGALDIWCPKVDSFEKHHAQYDNFRTNFGDRIWCYTCCIPGGKWMNRLMDGELIRPVLIPWVSVMFDVEGFLHWGYNHWLRGENQDPFKEPYPKRFGGANNGNSLPPGDTHIVYPGPDAPWPSVRLEATRAGMEDADLLLKLRAKDKEKAHTLIRRMARGFGDFNKECKLYREVRRDILLALSEMK
jgi:hypothetical protein